jgi:hypothetical protein
VAHPLYKRTAEHFQLDDTRRGEPASGAAVSGRSATLPRLISTRSDGEVPGKRPFSVNPLREEPSRMVRGVVSRFGLPGLIVCALSTGMTRWIKQLRR